MATAVALALFAASVPPLAGRLSPAIAFNFGPGDHRYLEGFEPMWEIDPDGRATHWSSYDAAVRLPFRISGAPARLTYRFSRVYAQTAELEVQVNGIPLDRFRATGGAYVERSVLVPEHVLASRLLEVRFRADSHERRNRGLRLDWLRLEPHGPGARVSPAGRVAAWAALLSLAFWLLLRTALGAGIPAAAWAAVIPAALLVYGAACGPFPLAHALRTTSPIGAAFMLAGVLVARRLRPGAPRVVCVLTAAAFLVRAFGVFHPLYYYPDLRAHAQLTGIVAEAGLDFWARPAHYISEQGVWAEAALGKVYAFPFSPVFHALFVPLGLDLAATMDAMKLAACLLSALEVPAVFFIGSRIGGEGGAAWAAALSAVSPVALFRLAYAFLAAVFAHFFDTLAIAALFARPARLWAPAATLLLLQAFALASYPGSLVAFGALVPALAVAFLLSGRAELRREALLLALGAAAAAALVIALVYREFLMTFLSDMLPRFLSSPERSAAFEPLSAVRLLAQRFWSFYGPLYIPLLAAGGLVWLMAERPAPRTGRLLLAWAMSFLILCYLRSAAHDLFSRVKEFLWVSPLVCLAGGAALAWIGRAFRRGPWSAAAAYGLLAAYGIWRYSREIAHTFALAR